MVFVSCGTFAAPEAVLPEAALFPVLQATAHEESQARIKLQMELDSKDSEMELLRRQASSAAPDQPHALLPLAAHLSDRLEGWLSVPQKQNIRRHGWRRQYVVVSSRKILFYNSEADRANADPVLVLDLSKLFHVRSVTQGDVIRADAKDIPRIFQVGMGPSTWASKLVGGIELQPPKLCSGENFSSQCQRI